MTLAATPLITHLTVERDNARDRFFAHHNPGNLTTAQLLAFNCRNMARLLELHAAQAELDAETRLSKLLKETA